MTVPTLPKVHSSSQHGSLELLSLEPLTPSAFAEFGSVISPPFRSSLTTPPRSSSSIPVPLHSPHQPAPVFANQNSALKTSPISQFTDNYASSPSTNRASTPQMSMFSCFPRNMSGIGIERLKSPHGEHVFKVAILERHPYTTQTFSPLGLSAGGTSTMFLVIVAPSLPSSVTATLPDGFSKVISSPPDLRRVRAFIAQGNQALTYAPGTWHAPMVVLGQERVDFVVTQFVNGVADDDCQEVLLGENGIGVELKKLQLQFAGNTTKPRL